MKKLGFIAATVLAIGVAAPALAQDPGITITVGKASGGTQGPTTTVLYGERVRVSGMARPNEQVTVFVEPSSRGGNPVTVRLDTDSTGAFQYIHRPTSMTRYHPSYGGRTWDPAVAFVRLKIRLRLIRASARHGTFRITTPVGAPSGAVWFERRVTRNRWDRVRKFVGAGGVFTVRLPPGTQRVRVVIPKTRAYLAATSPVLVVRR